MDLFSILPKKDLGTEIIKFFSVFCTPVQQSLTLNLQPRSFAVVCLALIPNKQPQSQRVASNKQVILHFVIVSYMLQLKSNVTYM